MELTPTDPSEFACNNKELLTFWLERFMLEVRNKHGNKYSPNGLHQIIVGIMRHVRAIAAPTIDFLKDGAFGNFRKTLNGEMKRLTETGKDTIKKQVEALTDKDEELLWSKGFLGDHSPKSILNTIFYICGLYFALCSGGQHRSLGRLRPRLSMLPLAFLQRPFQF